MSNAEKLADEFEKGETDIEKVGKGGGKRTKVRMKFEDYGQFLYILIFFNLK